ncbi:MAG: peptide ABC transporter substrate-binding protein [Acidimicrobiia bacterium]
MKRTKWLGLFAALALVLAACSPSDDGGATTTEGDGGATPTTAATTDTTEAPVEGAMAGQGGPLTILQWQAPSQANGMLSSGTKDALASSLVLDPLADIAPDGSLVPVLASEIPTVGNGVADDFSSITWKLKEDVLWSDGTPFTSDDVVFSWEYCADELTGCSVDFSTVESVVADDDYTVTINFTTPQAYPYTVFVAYLSPVIQRAQFQDCVGEQASACTEQNFAPVGTGPYMVTDLKPEDVVSYEYNPNFRGAAEGKPFFTSITLKGGGDAEAAARSVLEIGEADYAWNLQVAPEILNPMEAAGNGRVVTSFTANVEHINLNQTDPRIDPPSEYVPDGSNNNPIFFNNVDFSHALSLAIDRDSLVAVGYGPTGTPTCTMWPVGDQQSHNNDQWCEYDPDQANQILDDLGYLDSDGDGVREFTDGTPLEFDYKTSTNAVRQSNQEIVKVNWEAIGVVANMSNEDASLFFDGTSASDASIWKFFTDIQMYTNGATTPDPIGYLGGYRIVEIPTAALGWPASNNIVRMQSPEFDAAWDVASGLSITDPGFNDSVIGLQDLIAETGAVIPLIHRGNVSGIALSIDGFGDPNGWDSEYWNIEDWTRTG